MAYDAWNRLISVSDGDTLVATYMYDARNHRIKKTVGDETRLYYFNQQWQCVEERVGTTVDATWIYGLRYIDDVICRTTSNTGDIQTLYALQDPNWNVVALVTPSGTVAERLTYDSFGRVTFRNASFVANVSQTTSSYSWSKTFTGQVYDVETGLMLYRNRYYHPTLGRFITRDPIGYTANDANLYRYVRNMATGFYDAYGNVPQILLPPIPIVVTEGVNPHITPSFAGKPKLTLSPSLLTELDTIYKYVKPNDGCTKDQMWQLLRKLQIAFEETQIFPIQPGPCQVWADEFQINIDKQLPGVSLPACLKKANLSWRPYAWIGGHAFWEFELSGGVKIIMDNNYWDFGKGKFEVIYPK